MNIAQLTANRILEKKPRDRNALQQIKLQVAKELRAKSVPKNNNFKQSSENQSNGSPTERKTRKSKFKSLLLDKNFEPENPKLLEELSDETCRWPIGHPDQQDFYFCGRTSMKDFSYCKLHILYAYQPKNKKEELFTKEDGVPQFIEKKIKSA